MTRISSEKKSSIVHPKPKEENQLKIPERLWCLQGKKNHLSNFKQLTCILWVEECNLPLPVDFQKKGFSLTFRHKANLSM